MILLADSKVHAFSRVRTAAVVLPPVCAWMPLTKQYQVYRLLLWLLQVPAVYSTINSTLPFNVRTVCVFISRPDRSANHLYATGQRGTGISSCLASIILALQCN